MPLGLQLEQPAHTDNRNQRFMTLNLEERAIFEIEITVRGYPITWENKAAILESEPQIVHSV